MNHLLRLRSRVGVTQAKFASLMGVPLRTYEDLEAGRSKLRDIHVHAALFAVMEMEDDIPHYIVDLLIKMRQKKG